MEGSELLKEPLRQFGKKPRCVRTWRGLKGHPTFISLPPITLCKLFLDVTSSKENKLFQSNIIIPELDFICLFVCFKLAPNAPIKMD